MWQLLAGAGAGLGKHYLVDKPKQERMAKLAGATERYSPWTGLHAKEVEQPNLIGNLVGGAATGGLMGQQFAGGKPATLQTTNLGVVETPNKAVVKNEWGGFIGTDPSKIMPS
jgi:hypothetical protein